MIPATPERRLVQFERSEPAPTPAAPGNGKAAEADPYETIRTRLRALLVPEIGELIAKIASAEPTRLDAAAQQRLAGEMAEELTGLGPLEPFLKDDSITDIVVNGPHEIYVERDGKFEKTAARFRDVAHLLEIARRIAGTAGRHLDESRPMVDARMRDGGRANIVLPPLVLNGGSISIRKFAKQRPTLDSMVAQGNLSAGMARFLAIAGAIRANILICGGTGSGKTTLLNAISRSIDPSERVVTIEDTIELQLQQPHVVQMEARLANQGGGGEIDQRELLRNALRMRPNRIIVGEVRGVEAFDMLQAMNTGHDGSMSTIHGNSPRDAIYRLENMVMMSNANMQPRWLRAQIASCIHLVVHMERMADGVRRVQTITELAGMEGEVVVIRDLFAYRYSGEMRGGRIGGEFVSTRMRPDLLARAKRIGLDRDMLRALEIGGP